MRLLEATENGDVDAVKSLLGKGANLRVKNRGQTALQLAVKNLDKLISLLHLEYGADPEIAGRDGSKPLFIAIYSAGLGGFELVGILLSFNPNVESFNLEIGHTALHQTLTNGYPAATGSSYLEIEHTFHQVLKPGYTAVVELLLKIFANIDARALTRKAILHY